ncbi:DUF4440 domain-containing protein [Serratia marcescens]|uniref:DUF4440 domain-containing protein n=1 Tax=Serratia TaxID=613 RepID=UPI0014616905|nr:DUF4440 domain-containing protein [Serratia marcescens]MBH3189333.1 DUF4440 domain-containing protein [Serratia marcescens]NMQ37631.1 DUF4440 domain-containing protein [Serratia marcescens]
MKINPALTLTSLFIIAPFSVSAANDCQQLQTKQVESLFEMWETSIRSGIAEEVVKNYTKDAILIPTLSNEVRDSNESRESYFTEFLKKNPSAKINYRKIETGCNFATDSGTYTFTLNNKEVVKARYTFTYKRIGDEWLISSHHSSMMPEDT